MKSKTLYTCEICHTDYSSKERAKECEKFHHKDIKNIKPLFKPMNMGLGKYPYKIIVEFGDGKNIEYRT